MRNNSEFYVRYRGFRSFLAKRGGRVALPDDLDRLKRDRLPPWIDEVEKDARILDAGCAEGYLLEALARVDYENLTGIDLSADILTQARHRLPSTVRLLEANVLEWIAQCPESSFDVIFFNQVLEHLHKDDVVRLLKEFHRVLSPGGRLSISVPNMASLIGSFTMAIDFTHVTHFTECSLVQVLELSGFSLDKINFVSQAPRLFWSWRAPHLAFFRLLNRGRWRLNYMLHWFLYYVLLDFPYATVFDPSLVVVARK